MFEKKPIERASGALECAKCHRPLARMVDGVVVAGNIRIWNEFQFSCVNCGRAYRFWERLPERPPKDVSVAYETLNDLGKEPLPQTLVLRKKRKVNGRGDK
jgi:RNase P subunit RPR2